MRLVAIILAHNEAEHIQDCIASLLWTDEVVVFESGSTDDTVALAKAAGATVITHPFEHFAAQRNAALQAVDADWVLFVDADERVTPELAKEIQSTLQNPSYMGYNIPRHNYIFGKLTRHTGWYPDYQLRLLKRDSAHYDPNIRVHEVVILADNASAGYLQNPLIHYNYRDLAQFIRKQRYYAKLDAEIWYHQGIRPKPRNFILQPLRAFKRRFITWQGYKDGWHGFRLSVLMAWNEWDKYWQLWKLTRQRDTR